jgi:branched-chain amino acid transport system ATP-binding protein
VVLLGANGAGKTTLLKTIMSLVEPWNGRIDFAGEDITGCAPISGFGAALSYVGGIGISRPHHRRKYFDRRAIPA